MNHSLRPLQLSDYMQNGTEIAGWMTEIADASEGEFTAQAIAEVIQRGSHQAWGWCPDQGEVTGLLVTTRVEFANGATLMFVGAGGDCKDGFAESVGIFNDMAKSMQCVAVEMKGRSGLARMFAKYGYTQKHVVIRREVTEDSNIVPIELNEAS